MRLSSSRLFHGHVNNNHSPGYRLPALWLLLVGLLASSGAWGLEIDNTRERQPLLSGATYVESQPLKIAEVLALPKSNWQTFKGEINAGYTNDVHWYRLRLYNPNPHAVKRLLEIGYPLLDHIEFYAVVDGQVVDSWVTGDSKPFEQRPLNNHNFVFPITLPAQASQAIYLRVDTAGALQVPLTLWQERAFHAASERGLAGRAMFYGILLVMAAFNLCLFISLRERAYLLLMLNIVAILLLMTSLQGFSFRYLYPQLPRLNELMVLLMVPLTLVSLCLFTMAFLPLKRANVRWYRLFQGLVLASSLCVLGALVLPYHLSTTLSVYLSLPVAIANLAAGLLLWRRGDESARPFSIAWMALLAGIILAGLNKVGILPTLFITRHGITLGACVQMLLFSFALAGRFNREREARFHAMRQRHEVEQRLLRAASHHAVSGLPNRVLFERCIQFHLDAPREHQHIAVALVHLRRFDEINKTLGYQNADELIRQVAERLNRVLSSRRNAIVLESNGETCHRAAHVEGVSFAFALTGTALKDMVEDITTATQTLTQPIDFMDISMNLSFLVGCSFAPQEPVETQTLLRQAFIAFDRADMEIGGFAIYKAEMNPYSPRRLALMAELRVAIEQDRLELYFQPQIHLQSHAVAGFEALLRWTHPQYGFIPPDEFIPMAEQTGLIKPLTAWVIKRALAFCADLDRVACDATVAVNISVVNLREPDFCEQVQALLGESQIAAQRLTLEVTETAAMVDHESALSVLHALRASGVRLSIDDFGTGHSSLAYIRELPVQEIKIDRSFVMEMDHQQGDATIVRTTINMCHDLGYEVVAEGVENQAICERLGELGCDFIQGYHIARPQNRDKVLAWLEHSGWSKQSAPSEVLCPPAQAGGSAR